MNCVLKPLNGEHLLIVVLQLFQDFFHVRHVRHIRLFHVRFVVSNVKLRWVPYDGYHGLYDRWENDRKQSRTDSRNVFIEFVQVLLATLVLVIKRHIVYLAVQIPRCEISQELEFQVFDR